jgi:hypothetical protein
MKMRTPGPWRIKVKSEAIGILGNDLSLVAVVRRRNADAYLIAAAPLLLDACKLVMDALENNFIVTAEGFKINDAYIRESLLDAIMRAEGYRKEQGQP